MAFIEPNQYLADKLASLSDSVKTEGTATAIHQGSSSSRSFDPSSSHRAYAYCENVPDENDTGFYWRDHAAMLGVNLRVRSISPKLSAGTLWGRGIYARNTGIVELAGYDCDMGLGNDNAQNSDCIMNDHTQSSDSGHPKYEWWGRDWTLMNPGETNLDFKGPHLRAKNGYMGGETEECIKHWRDGVYVFSGFTFDLSRSSYGSPAFLRYRGSSHSEDYFDNCTFIAPNGDRLTSESQIANLASWDSGNTSTFSLSVPSSLRDDFQNPFFDGPATVPQDPPDPIPVPPQTTDWATKADLDALRQDMNQQMVWLQSELTTTASGLRAEINGMANKLRNERETELNKLKVVR